MMINWGLGTRAEACDKCLTGDLVRWGWGEWVGTPTRNSFTHTRSSIHYNDLTSPTTRHQVQLFDFHKCKIFKKFELIEHTYVMDVEHQDGTCCGKENQIDHRNIWAKLQSENYLLKLIDE